MNSSGAQFMLHKHFLKSDQVSALWGQLERLDWQQESFKIFGRRHLAPRKSCWFGDSGLNYRYAGSDHLAQPWPTELQPLHAEVTRFCGCDFNYVLLNHYQSGAEYMGWHKDDERGSAPHIAALSLGAERPFDLEVGDKWERIILDSGSLLCFDGRIRHRLPKTMKVKQPRISLTFRSILRHDA